MSEYPFGRATGSFFLEGGEDLVAGFAGVPLLAYGANASPQRLAQKLPGARVAALAGRVRGWAVVHSAHVSPYGAVPATLLADASASIAVHALLLDPGTPALAALDATEPNYERTRLTGLDLVVEHLGRLEAADAYVSRWGPLMTDGQPVVLGALSQERLRTLLPGDR